MLSTCPNPSLQRTCAGKPAPAAEFKRQAAHSALRARQEVSQLLPQQHIFISYCRADQEYANALCTWLNGHGVHTWIDQRIARGAEWEAEISTQLDSAGALVVLMSKAARRSKWVDREVKRAMQNGTQVYPLLLDVNGMLPSVAHLQLENVTGGGMPSLHLCQRLPGFLVTENDLAEALTEQQKAIAKLIAARVGGVGPRTPNGPAVAAIQMELLRVGLDPGPVDGVCGRKTQDAIREFQARRCDMPTADGIVGPRILAILVNSSFGDMSPTASRTTGEISESRPKQRRARK